MDENKNPIDPLDAVMRDLIDKHTAASGETPTTPPATEPEEDIYGENDMQESIKAEDDAREAERAALAAEQKAVADANAEKRNTFMPPDEKDMSYHAEAIGFQTEKLAIVTTMINKVVAKYRLISGAIPKQIMKDNTGRVVLDQVAVKAELCELYEKNGEVITPEFENMILENWIMPDGTFAADNIVDGVVIDKTLAPKTTTETKSDRSTANDVTEEAVSDNNPQINITVEPNTPVTVNVDESVVANISKSRAVDIIVKEVSETELKMANIIENSNIEGIITTYDSGINDVPLTLPLSGYRCVMRSINWFDFIKLTAPTSNNGVDDVRNIIQQAKTKSINSEYKIFIIDECHALSNSAWQAMLKIIEETRGKYCVSIRIGVPAAQTGRTCHVTAVSSARTQSECQMAGSCRFLY